MKCKKFKEMISLYIDAKLSSKETEMLKKHFQTCRECEKEYTVLKNIKNILSRVDKKELSSSFSDSVMDKIKNKTYEEDKNVVFMSFIKKHFLMAAGFIFIVLSSSLFFINDSGIVNKKANNEYYASTSQAIEYYFGNENGSDADTDDYEEYILSLFA